MYQVLEMLTALCLLYPWAWLPFWGHDIIITVYPKSICDYDRIILMVDVLIHFAVSIIKILWSDFDELCSKKRKEKKGKDNLEILCETSISILKSECLQSFLLTVSGAFTIVVQTRLILDKYKRIWRNYHSHCRV